MSSESECQGDGVVDNFTPSVLFIIVVNNPVPLTILLKLNPTISRNNPAPIILICDI